MTGWNTTRNPNGIRLYAQQNEEHGYGETLIKVEIFLDEKTCLHLRDSITLSEREFWKPEKKQRKKK